MQESRITRAAEIAYVALILALAAIVWREAGRLPPAPYDPLGPKAFPIWVSYALAGLGLAMILRMLVGGTLGHAAQSMVVGLGDAAGAHRRRPGTALVTLVLAFAYAAALSFRGIGFLPATAAYLFLAGMALSPLTRRRAGIMAVFAVAAAFALDLLFRTIFKLDLG